MEITKRALNVSGVTALLYSLVACGGGGGSSAPAPSPAPVAAPSPPASAPAPSPPASSVSAGLFVPTWPALTCDESSGDLSYGTVQYAGNATYDAGELFTKINAARLAMCSGSLQPDSTGALAVEAMNQGGNATGPEYNTDAFSGVKTQNPGQYSISDSWGGSTLDANVDALDGSGLEVAQDALAYTSSFHLAKSLQSPKQRLGATFPELQESDTRVVLALNHDSPLAMAQRCLNELLSQPAQRERLLDPRFRLLGAAIRPSGYRFDVSYVATGDASDDADAMCYAVEATTVSGYSAAGLATAPAGWVGVWPPSGSEIPFGDIHARGAVDGTRHGYAASVTVDSHYTLSVQLFTITDSAGKVVPVVINGDALTDSSFGNWAFATPVNRLPLATEFTAHFVGVANGVAIDKHWTFSTPGAEVLFDPRNDGFTP